MADQPEGIVPYNPLDKQNLGISVADALLQTELRALPPPPFEGAGIYAIYYRGAFALYKNMGSVPIYVGKAIPPGARKGGFGLSGSSGRALHNRLRQHAKSIEEAKNLDPGDFKCQLLIVEDIWIPLGEALLIERFKPVWNQTLEGFGNHDPGSGRYNQQRSPWDVLHPGRPWAEKCAPNDQSSASLKSLVREHRRSNE